MTDRVGDFWNFSLAVYEQPPVAAACLALQDRLGLDVNLLLYCCWTARCGCRLSEDDLDAAEAAVEPWQHDIVRPLRLARRRLKAGFAGLPPADVEALRRRLGDVELDAEKIAQEALARLPPPAAAAPASAATSAANLTSYLRLRRRTIGPLERASLLALIAGCFPGEATVDIAVD